MVEANPAGRNTPRISLYSVREDTNKKRIVGM